MVEYRVVGVHEGVIQEVVEVDDQREVVGVREVFEVLRVLLPTTEPKAQLVLVALQASIAIATCVGAGRSVSSQHYMA